MPVLLSLALLAGGAVATLLQQSSAIAQTPVAYIALGDSIAFGTGSSLPEKRGYPPQIRDLIQEATGNDVALYNLAVPGETAASFMTSGQVERLAETRRMLDEQNTPISVVTISLGGNEMLAQRYSGVVERQQALQEFSGSLESAVARVRDEIGTSATLVLTTYYDLSEGDPGAQSTDAWWIEEFNDVIRDVASRHSATVAELEPAFSGRIDELTHHPYDVHPNNQGYRAIARQVWSALALDTEAPDIRMLSEETATRRTPTLQIEATDNVGVTEVSVLIDDEPAGQPVDLGDGRYVLLLDLREREGSEFDIVVEARDLAGNTSRSEVQLVVNSN